VTCRPPLLARFLPDSRRISWEGSKIRLILPVLFYNISVSVAYFITGIRDRRRDTKVAGMLIKVIAVQSPSGKKLSQEEKLRIFKQRPDFVCLPEYCLISEDAPDFGRAALMIKENLEYLRSLSDAFSTCLIGGSVVEGEADVLYNNSYIFHHGQQIGKYRKLNPVAGELEMGILPGDKLYTAVIDDVKIGLMICADALNPELFAAFRPEEVDLIFIPTTSPYRPQERKIEKFRRDNEIYVDGAQRALSYVIKVCGVGTLFGKRLQGRSLVASPWGVLNRVDPQAELYSCILTTVIDIDELRDFRQKKLAAGG
jgi:predicted amidohydrolase